MEKAILITGGTGFVGQQILKKISKDLYCFVLVRTNSMSRAQELFKDYKNIELIEGDISQYEVFALENDISKMDKFELDVIHCAALYELDSSLADNYIANVLGTQNLLMALDSFKNIKQFIYMSTIAVSGNLRGDFYEHMLLCGQSFSSDYAKTKFDAENIVNNHVGDYTTIILRPGGIVGDSFTGDFDKADGPYYIIQAFYKLASNNVAKSVINKVGVIPMTYSPDAKLPLVSVDTVASFTMMIVMSPPKNRRVFHVTDMSEGCSVEAFFVFVAKKVGLNIRFTPLREHIVLEKAMPLLSIPKESLGYMYQSVIYDCSATREEYPNYQPQLFWDYADTIIDKAIERFNK